jgi:hypothetical protein
VAVTEFDAALAEDAPIALEATTVAVVDAELLKPVILIGEEVPVAVLVTAAKLS